ncbi:MAG: hypothetical protein QM683_15050, partial [Lacrimispora sp.]
GSCGCMIVWVQVPSPALLFFERGRFLRTGLLIVNAKVIRLKGAGLSPFKPDIFMRFQRHWAHSSKLYKIIIKIL